MECRLLISNIFDAMNFHHFSEMLEFNLGGVHKLREQGRGKGVVLEMFTLVHKGEEGGSANVHVGLNCKYFK